MQKKQEDMKLPYVELAQRNILSGLDEGSLTAVGYMPGKADADLQHRLQVKGDVKDLA